ncbi:MAG: hypothetical protein KF789_14425, partial [Bdellovibrionaceae bacterium]|nr:hypothetical protein [Pseudobdellovibrionaceae bacterium]
GLDLGQQMLETNPKKFFPLADVAKVAGEVSKLDLLPDGFSRQVVTDLLKPVLNRILNPVEKRLAGQRPEALRQSSLEQLRTEFMVWAETAEYLSDAFDGSDQSTMKAAELQAIITRGINRKSSSALLKIGLRELSAIFETGHSLVLDRERRVYISVGGRLKYNLRSVERHNIIRALSRLVIGSYANDIGRIRRYQGITKTEANTAFRDFRGVGVAMGLLDPKNTGFMDSRFREANMFMPRSDGNNLASFIEIHEIAFSIAGGLVLDSKLKNELRGCPGAKQRRVQVSCMYSAIRSKGPTHFSSMPDLIKYQRGVKDEVYATYFYNTLKGSGWVPNAQNLVTYSDASLQPQLLQYIEFIFARFDANADGGISAKEALRAFPVFRGLFLEVAKKDLESGTITEAELPALFTYILKYGKPPAGVWEGLTRWYPWKNANPDTWEVWADRGMMASILAFISDQINGASLINAPADGAKQPQRQSPNRDR